MEGHHIMPEQICNDFKQELYDLGFGRGAQNSLFGNGRNGFAGNVVSLPTVGDAQIWRDNLMGAPKGLFFVSDALKEKMVKAKLAAFTYRPVAKV